MTPRARRATVSIVQTALLLTLLAGWLGCSAVCALKGRRWYAVGNLFVLGTVSGWFGVARLAKPNSWWARRYYGPDKLAQARVRHAIHVRGYPR
jgi:hypothetical protein